jgi:hypothetical protein
MIEINSRVHRILKPLAAFREFHKDSDWPSALEPRPVLDEAERALGVYSDDLPTFSNAIIITTRGLYVRSGRTWMQILYSEIKQTISPPSKAPTGLEIVKRDGVKIWLPVSGAQEGRFYDAFEILRFVSRVTNDIASA